MDAQWRELAAEACLAARQSTSKTHVVGAAILGSDGNIYRGANYPVDNHRSTVHAEDAAVASMFSYGGSSLLVRRLVTVAFDWCGGEASPLYFTYPCGSCRNLIAQYTAYGTEEQALIYWDGAVKTIEEVYPKGSEAVPVGHLLDAER